MKAQQYILNVYLYEKKKAKKNTDFLLIIIMMSFIVSTNDIPFEKVVMDVYMKYIKYNTAQTYTMNRIS